jgi:hypothetical protein
MTTFLPALRRTIFSTLPTKSLNRSLFLITDKDSPEGVQYLSQISHLEKGWSVKVTGLFPTSSVEGNKEYIRHISGSGTVQFELEDGSVIDSAPVGKFIKERRVDVLAVDVFDGVYDSIEGFPFEDVIAERIVVNMASADEAQVERQLNNHGYLHIDSGIFIPSQNVISKFNYSFEKKVSVRGFVNVP